jgi:hypothetical protein
MGNGKKNTGESSGRGGNAGDKREAAEEGNERTIDGGRDKDRRREGTRSRRREARSIGRIEPENPPCSPFT